LTPTSSALKFNAVADWWDEYIAFVVARSSRHQVFTHPRSSYDVLKRHIYQLEKEHHRLSRANIDLEANERTALVDQPDFSSIDAVFIPRLNQELQKISLFYEDKEKELFDDLQTLEALVAEQDQVGPAAWEHYMDEYADEEDDDDDDDDDDEQISGERVHFENESLPKRRRRKSTSAGLRPRSGSRKSSNSCSTRPY
jgi:phosphate transporter